MEVKGPRGDGVPFEDEDSGPAQREDRGPWQDDS